MPFARALLLWLACAAPAAAAGGAPPDAFRDCDACPEMVPVPAGEIDLGLERAPSGLRTARIASRLAVGRYEVTFEEWESCAAEGACRKLDDRGFGRGRRPAIGVRFTDAEAYVRWLAARTGQRYRLPTQAEWEVFVRGGAGGDPWAEFVDGNCEVCDPAYAGRNTAPVGSYRPNGFGLHDVLGNVWEWAADCVEQCRRRLLLGGSYRSGALFLAGGIRLELPGEGPDLADVGLRVVRDEARVAARP